MVTLPSRVALFLACLLMIACHHSPPSLVGTYSADDKGKRVEFMRIEQKDGKFLASESQMGGGGWKKPVEVKPLGKDDLEKIARATVPGDVVGLGTNEAALFQVPVGWKIGGFESKTGYVFISLFGPLEVHKDGK